MTPAAGRTRRGLAPLALIAAAFAVPLLVASWLYSAGPDWQPVARSNSGQLLEPIVNLGEQPGVASLASLTGGASDGHWVLLYSERGPCAADCEFALYRQRQARLMLGKDMQRVIRVFLHADAAPDRVFPDTSHPGLITITDTGLGDVLDARRPAGLAAGGLFLVDPLGNLVMYFPPDLEPGRMVDDIEHLLDLSHIG